MSGPAPEIKSKAVRAGAGAGKTYNLTHEVLGFALAFREKNKRWPRVAVTTFTRKATQELSERLVKLAMVESPGALEFVSSAQYLRVSTIHGILDRFLKEFGHVAGLKSDFGYMKESEALFAAKKTLRTLSAKPETYGPVFSSFSFRQLTELLLKSVEYDLGDFRPITEKDLRGFLAADLDRLRGELGKVLRDVRDVEVGDKLRAIWSKLEKIEPLMTLEKWPASYDSVGEVIDSISLVGVKPKKEPAAGHYEVFKSVWEEVKELAKPVYDPAAMGNLDKINSGFLKLHGDFKKHYDEFKKTASRVEMSDLETFSMEIIRQSPDAACAFSADTDFWLIDEFQDTSPRQLEILEALIGNKPFYLVGDPQQSIYLFRGARSEVFHDKAAELQSAGGSYDVLDTNYRSTPSLLSFINDLSKGLGAHFASMKPAEGKEESKGSGVLAHAACMAVIGGDKTVDRDALELENLYAHIIQLNEQKIPFEQMAVLGRKNKDLEMTASFLAAKGLPVHLHSSGLFWQRREVQDAVALLKFFINPYDDYNLTRLLRAPFLAISDQEMLDKLTVRNKKSVWEVLRGAEVPCLGKLLDIFAQREALGVVVAFQRALEGLGFFDLHLRADSTGRAEGNLWKFVHLLKTFERERGANFIRFVKEAEKAKAGERTPDTPGSIEPDKINLMTVHAAKGLQFDCVFLPFLGKNSKKDSFLEFAVDETTKTWSVRSPASDRETKTAPSLFEARVLENLHVRNDEEDLRVFYVAYTRAKRHIYFSWQKPAGKNSWATRLESFNSEAGVHNGQGYTYEVQQIDSIEAIAARPARRSAVAVPPMFAGTREVDWLHAAGEVHAVTKLLKIPHPASAQSTFIKKNQGILFHRLMEIIRYPVERDMKRLLSDWFPGNTGEVAEALNFVFSVKEPPLLELIKTGKLEWSFRTRMDSALKGREGQIDLWGMSGEKLWIVDYKSGSAIQKDTALEQLRIYAMALREFLKWDKEIHLAIVYPFLQKTHIEKS